MFDRKGKIASWGAKIRADKPAAADATAIARFKASGALQIAALHLAEFAYGPTGHNYVLGHARNPWDPTRITGGSSAGTAAAVAYGAIPAGLGSDTGGSLRLPARVLRRRLDQADLGAHQPRRRHAAGARARHRRRDRAPRRGSGPDPGLPGRARPARSRVRQHAAGARLRRAPRRSRDGDCGSASTRPWSARRTPTCSAWSSRCAASWQAGPDARVLPLPRLADARPPGAARADAGCVGRARRLSAHAARTTTARRCAPALEVGHFISAVDHMTALRARGMYRRAHARTRRSRTSTSPSCRSWPTRCRPSPSSTSAAGRRCRRRWARVVKFTRPINYLGLPTLTLPIPRGGGLPNGIQLDRPALTREAQLFAVGQAYQREVPPEIARPLSVIGAAARGWGPPERRPRVARRLGFRAQVGAKREGRRRDPRSGRARGWRRGRACRRGRRCRGGTGCAPVGLRPGRDVGEIDRHRPRQVQDRAAGRRRGPPARGPAAPSPARSVATHSASVNTSCTRTQPALKARPR